MDQRCTHRILSKMLRQEYKINKCNINNEDIKLCEWKNLNIVQNNLPHILQSLQLNLDYKIIQIMINFTSQLKLRLSCKLITRI